MALIALKKWAIQNNIQPASARQKALRGKLVTAQKIGRDWLIDEMEPNVDNRIKNKKYIGWRKKKRGKRKIQSVAIKTLPSKITFRKTDNEQIKNVIIRFANTEKKK